MNERRIIFVSFLFIIGFLIVIFRLIDLQTRDKEILEELIKKQYIREEKVILPRGTIYDSNENILAISIPKLTIFAIPKYIKDKEKVSEELSKILKISKATILRKLKRHKGYVVISDNVDKSLKKEIEALRYRLKEWNIGILDNSKRFYPFNELGGSTIGFVNKITGKGAEGLEYKYNSILGGGLKKIRFIADATGKPLHIIDTLDNIAQGKDIVLTIDSNIQHIAEEVLNKYVKLRKPKGALILIVDPNTGDIVANATYPNYNPNKYWKYKIRKNITFQNAYEPGSLAKPFVLAKAIESRNIDLEKKYFCEWGKIVIDNVKIKDHTPFGELTVRDIIVHSSNVGIIKIALEENPKELYDLFFKLGFGKSTGTFPGEASGKLRREYQPVNVAYLSIGQSWTASPIQIAMAYSSIANGGLLLKPRILKKVIDKKTGKIEDMKPVVIRRVFKKETTDILKGILLDVVEKGTAKRGKSKFYTIAGKTGTAQKYDKELKRLSTEKYYTWFAGFFPATNPKYTIVILFDEPQKLYEKEKIGGGSVSAPILKDLVDRIMFYKKIKPDKGSN